jgi:hypothetical protein
MNKFSAAGASDTETRTIAWEKLIEGIGPTKPFQPKPRAKKQKKSDTKASVRVKLAQVMGDMQKVHEAGDSLSGMELEDLISDIGGVLNKLDG